MEDGEWERIKDMEMVIGIRVEKEKDSLNFLT